MKTDAAVSHRRPARSALWPSALWVGAPVGSCAWVTLSLFAFSCSASRGASSDAHPGDAAGGGRAGDIGGASGLAGGGGAAGSANAGGTGGAGGAGAGSGGASGGAGSVRIIRGDPNEPTWFSLTIEGVGLASDEGKLVTARIGHPQRPPERLGVAQARIQDGAFRIEFPQGCEGFLYKQKFLFIDVNADGLCTPGADRVYSDARFLASDITLTLADSVPAGPLNAQMRLSSTANSDCQALNEPWPDS